MAAFLTALTLLSMLTGVGALIWITVRTGAFSSKPSYAEPRGDSVSGILYALGPAMMPWNKESVRQHLPTWIIGIVYHLGILGAWTFLIVHMISGIPDGWVAAMQVVSGAGALSGIALLVKRLSRAHLRAISSPDDIAANLLVDLFLLTGFLTARNLVPASWWYGTAILMFLYMPLGKIRHCALFFKVRILYGRFFGSRGVFPASGGEQ